MRHTLSNIDSHYVVVSFSSISTIEGNICSKSKSDMEIVGIWPIAPRNHDTYTLVYYID